VGQYFVMALHYGNAHLLAIFLLFVSFYMSIKGKDFLAALLMALSITIKLTPILVLPYFALKNRWKYLLLTGVFLIIINLMPDAFFGFSKNAELLGSWRDHVLVDQEFHEANGPINLSLKGQLRRYLTSVDYTGRVDGDTAYPSVNLTTISTKSVDMIW